MKTLTGFTDAFISPVTGRSVVPATLPPLTYQYVWRGDINNNPVEVGNIDLGGYGITGLTDPQTSQDAVNLNFLWNIVHDGVSISWP